MDLLTPDDHALVTDLSLVYSTRKPLDALKFDLLQRVNNPLYWRTFRDFLSGHCQRDDFDSVMNACLTTNELKHMHNQLIRAILFNAHFSRVLPRTAFPAAPALARHAPSSDQS
jgi:hypothetical protein